MTFFSFFWSASVDLCWVDVNIRCVFVQGTLSPFCLSPVLICACLRTKLFFSRPHLLSSCEHCVLRLTRKEVMFTGGEIFFFFLYVCVKPCLKKFGLGRNCWLCGGCEGLSHCSFSFQDLDIKFVGATYTDATVVLFLTSLPEMAYSIF